MKQSSKFETDLLEAINKIQTQLTTLENKVNTLINRPLPALKPATAPTPPAANNNHPETRPKYDAICADCQKPCTIPFKPSADRPVYCKDCFSRRKVISMSKISVPEKPKEAPAVVPQPTKAPVAAKVETKKKKAVAAKKPAAKKKSTAKKK